MKDFSRYEELYGRAFALCLSAIVIISMLAPRFAGIGPPLVAFAFVILYRPVFARWPRIPKDILFWSLAFPALMALSALWSPWPDTALDRAVRTLPVTFSAGALMAIGLTLKPRARDFFRSIFPLAVLFAGLICAAEIYLKGPFYNLFHDAPAPGERFNLSLLNRSVVVLTFASIIAFGCIARGSLTNASKKLMAGVLALVLVAALYKTSSQSAQLGLLVAAVFCFAFPYKRKEAWIALTGLLTLLLLVTPWLTQYMFAHFADAIAESGIRMGYMQYRMEIWDAVSRRALERPLLGFGTEATKMMKDLEPAGKYWKFREILHPHNFAVQIWVEFGALGAALTAFFFASILKKIRDVGLPAARLFLPAFMACLSVAATGYGLWQTWWLGMFCLVLAAAPLLLGDENKVSKPR